jgi:hypothetical protein
MKTAEECVRYVLSHWEVVEYWLKWKPCGPDCQHTPQKDIKVKLVIGPVYYGDCK